MSNIHVTYDGDTSWLECFKDDPDAENGTIIDPIDAGDEWDGLAEKVRKHQAEHGCAQQPRPAPARQLLARVRADLGWIWRETTDDRAGERADQALTALKEAGIE